MINDVTVRDALTDTPAVEEQADDGYDEDITAEGDDASSSEVGAPQIRDCRHDQQIGDKAWSNETYLIYLMRSPGWSL